MDNAAESNKRIVKNTLFMYLRMLLTMVVSLYTSRVVLRTLGVDDYGIYNIVGGVVVLFTFINSAMASGTQRHLSYELGKKDEGNITEVFSACLKIHFLLAAVIFILAETIGLWFLNTQMNFPASRMEAVNWVYQFSILGCVASIVRVPYNAAIVAYERMSFYAYMGIIEAVLKLVVVYLLLLFAMDKLILYSILMFAVILLITLWFILFCHKNFERIRIVKVPDRQLYRKLVSFSGWALFGSVANVGLQQGINIIINIFYGVALNAAVGVANQVNSAISNFVHGFQQALNPQLVKSQAGEDKARQFQLICESSKLSFFIMFVMAFPLMVNLEYVLTLWLGEYPAHTVGICNMIIIGALIECLSGPLWVTIFATGNIKTYQIVISSILLLNIPVSYIGGRFGMSSEAMFAARNVIYVMAFLTRLVFLKRMIDMDVRGFFRRALAPILKVLCLTVLPIVLLVNKLTAPSDDFVTFIWQTLLICAYELPVIYLIGLLPNERLYIKNLFLKKIATKHGN